MPLQEAIDIMEAHMNGAWDSIYLQDAWETIKQKIKEENNELIHT